MDSLIEALKNNVVHVHFTKKNGEVRIMRCTLMESMLPKQIDLEESIQNKTESKTNIAVWDLEKKSWRSFRTDSVLKWSFPLNEVII